MKKIPLIYANTLTKDVDEDIHSFYYGITDESNMEIAIDAIKAEAEKYEHFIHYYDAKYHTQFNDRKWGMVTEFICIYTNTNAVGNAVICDNKGNYEAILWFSAKTNI